MSSATEGWISFSQRLPAATDARDRKVEALTDRNEVRLVDWDWINPTPRPADAAQVWRANGVSAWRPIW
jgi:hypothetical protein